MSSRGINFHFSLPPPHQNSNTRKEKPPIQEGGGGLSSKTGQKKWENSQVGLLRDPQVGLVQPRIMPETSESGDEGTKKVPDIWEKHARTQEGKLPKSTVRGRSAGISQESSYSKISSPEEYLPH